MTRTRKRVVARIRSLLSIVLVVVMLLAPRSGVNDKPTAAANGFTLNPLDLLQPLLAHAANATVNVQGKWVGTIVITGQGSVICTFSISQEGSALSGGGNCNNGASGSCSGTLVDAAMSLNCTLSTIGPLAISATISTDGTTATGTWQGSNGANGSYLATRQIDLATIFGHTWYVPFGGDPANLVSGGYFYRHVDLAIPARGISLAFTRAYNSQDTSVGPLGQGWTHSYDVRLLIASGSPPQVSVVNEDGNHDIYFQNADGSYSNPPGVYASLVHNGDSTYTLTRTTHDVLTFDASGRLTSLADQNGNTTTLSYTNGELTTISDPDGRGGSLTLTYDSCFTGRLCSIRDWLSPARTVSFAYDANGRLQTVTDRNGKVTTYAYDASNRLTTITDANNHQAIRNIYDSAGRVVEQHDAKNLANCVYYSTAPTYTSANCPGPGLTLNANQTLDVDRNGNKTLFTYDTSFRTTQVVDAANGTTTYTYDSNNNRTSTTDPLGNRTDRCFDTTGNLTRLVAPPPAIGQARPVTVFAYQGFDLIQTTLPKGVTIGNPTDCTATPTLDPNFYSTWNSYDAHHNLLSVTRKYGDPDLGTQTAITKFEYNDANNPGLVTKIIPPRGNTGANPDYSYATSFAYYASGSQEGMLQSTTDPLGNETTYTYDAVGRRLTMVDPNGNVSGGNPSAHTWSYAYDNEDRLTSTSAPAPTTGGSALTTTSTYDPVGNRTAVKDANGQVTKYSYDERDSLAQVQQSPNAWTDPNNPPAGVITTAYAYDNNGNLTRVTRASGDASNERATDYAYDSLNRLHSETQYPSWPTTTPTLLTSYTYDADGNLKTTVDPLNQTTTNVYDGLNRLTSVTYTDGTPNVSYLYDANGNRTSMQDGTGTTSYTLDELDRLLSVTSPGPKVVGYRYDLDGNETKVIYPDSTAVTYAFDKASQLQSLSDWASRQTSYQYNPDGSLKQATNFNGTTASYSYDNALRLTQMLNAKGSATISQHTYTLDNLGNRTQAVETLASTGSGVPMAWGFNPYGELGNGTTTNSNLPVQVVGPGGSGYLSGVTTVGVAGFHSLALTNDGTNWAWGYNADGELGTTSTQTCTNNNNPCSTTPLAISSLSNVRAMVGGGYHSLALLSDGTVRAWGYGAYGQLGNGSQYNQSTPVVVTSLSGVTALAGGVYYSLALKSDGTVWGWGYNGDGQLGATTSQTCFGVTCATTPIQVSGLSNATAIAAGAQHSLAVKSDGTIWAWGGNGSGQLGNGTTTPSSTPIAVGTLSNASAVAAGNGFSLALKQDGTVWAWGDNTYGQLGATSADSCGGAPCSKTPIQVSSLTEVVAIAAGGYHGLALKRDGTVWAWGLNVYGQLGDGTTTNRTTPVQVSGLSGITQIGSKAFHSLALAATHQETLSYGYDALARLTSVTAPGGPTTYSYDPLGNRLTKVQDGTTTSYTYDKADRILSAGSTS